MASFYCPSMTPWPHCYAKCIRRRICPLPPVFRQFSDYSGYSPQSLSLLRSDIAVLPTGRPPRPSRWSGRSPAGLRTRQRASGSMPGPRACHAACNPPPPPGSRGQAPFTIKRRGAPYHFALKVVRPTAARVSARLRRSHPLSSQRPTRQARFARSPGGTAPAAGRRQPARRPRHRPGHIRGGGPLVQAPPPDPQPPLRSPSMARCAPAAAPPQPSRLLNTAAGAACLRCWPGFARPGPTTAETARQKPPPARLRREGAYAARRRNGTQKAGNEHPGE